MAGTLTISTLSDGTNSTSSTNCIQGSAKAWVSLTTTSSATIGASYNVTSVTRNSAGNYTVNFTTAFSDNKYATCGISGTNFTLAQVSSQSTTNAVVLTTNTSGTAGDSTGPVSFIFFR